MAGPPAIEPALEEMRELMFAGKLSIAGRNAELIDEIRNYHRDEDFKSSSSATIWFRHYDTRS